MKLNSSFWTLAVAGLAFTVLTSCENQILDEGLNENEISVLATVNDAVPSTKADAKAAFDGTPKLLAGEGFNGEMYLIPSESTDWTEIYAPTTKGETIGSLSDLQTRMGNFSMFAFNASGGASYFSNVSFNYGGSSWNGGATWPGAGMNLNFFAVAPFQSSLTMNNGGSFNFTAQTVYADQKDILVGKKANVAGDGGTALTMTFDHALAAIKFKTSSTFSGTIKSVGLVGLKSTGTYTIGTGWSSQSGSENYDYTLETAVTAPSANLTPDGTAFLVMPQTFAAGSAAKLKIVYSTGGTDMTLYANITNGSSAVTWNPGYIYTYTVTANPTGVTYSLGTDPVDQMIFASLVLPANQAGISGPNSATVPTISFPDYTVTGWQDASGTAWVDSNHDGKFDNNVSGLVTLHPTWAKNDNYDLMSGVANAGHTSQTFTNLLHTYMTTNSATKVVFGNWSTYGATVGGSFSSGTFAGDTKYDEIRLFANAGTVYVLSKDAKNMYAAGDCTNLFSEYGRSDNKIIKIDLKYLKTSKVTKMSHMFYYCTVLDRILIDSNWTTSAVTDNGNDMFGCCDVLHGDWSTYVQGTDKTYARADFYNGMDSSNKNYAGGYLSTTENTYYTMVPYVAHNWLVAALSNGDNNLYLGSHNEYYGHGVTRPWADNASAHGYEYSGSYFNTDNRGNHHIADFHHPEKQNGYLLAEGDGIIVLVGDGTNFLNFSSESNFSSMRFEKLTVTHFDAKGCTTMLNFLMNNQYLTTVSITGDVDMTTVTSIDGFFANCAALSSVDFTGLYNMSGTSGTDAFLNAAHPTTINVRSSELTTWQGMNTTYNWGFSSSAFVGH